MSSHLEKTAHVFLTELLRPFGFEAVESLSYCRTISAGNEIIIVGCRSEDQKLKFTCTLGVIFDAIESLLRPNNSDRSYPTVSCPIHLLSPEREYYEWEGSNEEELMVALGCMIAEIQEVGLGFFDQFKTIAALEEELSASVVPKSLILSAHQKIGTLAAIALLRGERSKAERLFDDAIENPQNQNPGKQRRLKELRTQLLSK